MELTVFREWLKDAVKDGWILIDPNGESVSGELITEDGKWQMYASIYKNDCDVSMWAPDNMQCVVLNKYERPSKRLMRICEHCGAEDVDTFCYSFAGRACAKCLPALKEKYEYPGWCS